MNIRKLCVSSGNEYIKSGISYDFFVCKNIHSFLYKTAYVYINNVLLKEKNNVKRNPCLLFENAAPLT